MSDQTLHEHLNRLRKGDAFAMKSIFEAVYDKLCAVVFRFVQDQAATEDLVQQVFIRLWEKRQHLNISSSPEAYLRKMAVNEALYYLRRKKIFESEEHLQSTHAPDSFNAENLLIENEMESRIRTSIDALPPRCRTIFLLSRYEDLTYAEIGMQLEISVKTVENQMGKALRLLRDDLKEYLEPGDC